MSFTADTFPEQFRKFIKKKKTFPTPSAGVSAIGTSVDECAEYFCQRTSLATAASAQAGNLTATPVDGCSADGSLLNASRLQTELLRQKRPFRSWPIAGDLQFAKHLSYHAGGLVTLLFTVLVGCLGSLCTRPRRARREIDAYLAPFLQSQPAAAAAGVEKSTKKEPCDEKMA